MAETIHLTVQEQQTSIKMTAYEALVIRGVSPTATVDRTEDGALITITDAEGTTQAQVFDGEKGDPGSKGDPGPKPVKGVDYWTAADKSEIVAEAVEETEQDVASVLSAFAELEQHTDTAEYKQSIADKVAGDFVQDVQVNGASIVQDGVANVPIASNTNFGVVKVQAYNGLRINASNWLETAEAENNEVKTADAHFKPIVPCRQHAAAFYGLAKAAGDTTQKVSSNAIGQYTEQAKSAISTMLSGSVTVSGTTPTINALPGVSYVCGEVSTIDIVTPETGIVDITFVSGATPAVLTVTPPTGQTMKWANGFDPDNLEANTTYEINIKDGCLGVAGQWT